MIFKYSFKHMTTSEALTQYAERKIEEKITKFSTKPDEVHMTFSVDRHFHKAHCSVKGGDGFNCEVEYTSSDMYASVDKIVDRLEAQLKKQKEKIKYHKRPKLRGMNGSSSDHFDRLEIDAEDILKFEQARRKTKVG